MTCIARAVVPEPSAIRRCPTERRGSTSALPLSAVCHSLARKLTPPSPASMPAAPADCGGLIPSTSLTPHRHASCPHEFRSRRPRPSSPQRAHLSGRLAALALRHQSQGHRHDVSVVLTHHAHERRCAGDAGPAGTLSTWPAIFSARAVQPVRDPAQLNHGVRRDHAGRCWLRELDDSAADRRLRHGLCADE